MKICVLAPEFLPNWGGTGTYLANLFKYIPKRVDIHVVTVNRDTITDQPDQSTEDIAELLGRPLTIHRLSSAKENFFYNISFQIACLRKLPELCRQNDFDIIHTNHPHMPDLFSRMMNRIRIPKVTTVHEVMTLKRQLILKSGVEFAHLAQSEKAILTLYPFLRACEILQFKTGLVFIAPSKYYAKILTTLGVKENQIYVIPNGVDTSVFRRMTISSHDRPTILFAGRFVSQKGIETIIDTMPKVLNSIPDAQFMFSGAEMPPRYLDAIKNRHVPNESVKFIGYVSNYLEMPRVYSRADVYILPSISENCPMSVLEAMSCETPVVAGYGGGTPELIESGQTGILIPPRNSTALANAIISLLQDRHFATQIAEAGRKRILEKFSAETTANSTMQVYEKMIGCFV